jgi:hypothetical protein
MTWHERVVVQILLLVARMVARAGGHGDAAEEIKTLATHLAVRTPETREGQP